MQHNALMLVRKSREEIVNKGLAFFVKKNVGSYHLALLEIKHMVVLLYFRTLT